MTDGQDAEGVQKSRENAISPPIHSVTVQLLTLSWEVWWVQFRSKCDACNIRGWEGGVRISWVVEEIVPHQGHQYNILHGIH